MDLNLRQRQDSMQTDFFFFVCDMMRGDYIQHIMIEDILIHSLKCPFVLYMQFHLLPRM